MSDQDLPPSDLPDETIDLPPDLGDQDRQQITSAADRLARLYQRWALDCVVGAAYAVALDFRRRPDAYQNLDPEVADALTDLQVNYGNTRDFPSYEDRRELMRPYFGPSDSLPAQEESSEFHDARRRPIAAAVDFAEHTQTTGFPMLRDRFRSSLIPMQTWLQTRQGSALNSTDARTDALFGLATVILRDAGVRSVFNVGGTISNNWPLTGQDASGAQLIGRVTSQLAADVPHGQISPTRFVQLQRIASTGRSAIEGAMSDQQLDNDALDSLMSAFYTWGSELGLVVRR